MYLVTVNITEERVMAVSIIGDETPYEIKFSESDLEKACLFGEIFSTIATGEGFVKKNFRSIDSKNEPVIVGVGFIGSDENSNKNRKQMAHEIIFDPGDVKREHCLMLALRTKKGDYLSGVYNPQPGEIEELHPVEVSLDFDRYIIRSVNIIRSVKVRKRLLEIGIDKMADGHINKFAIIEFSEKELGETLKIVG